MIVYQEQDFWHAELICMLIPILHVRNDRRLAHQKAGWHGYAEHSNFACAYLQSMCFVDSIDAVGYALHLQESLLEVQWPEEILSNCHACEVLGTNGKRLFNGLRFRLAMHTAIPTNVQASAWQPA